MILKSVTSESALEVLKKSGLVREVPADKNDLAEILQNQGLGLENIIERLSGLALDSSDPAVQSRSIETALKLHKVFAEDKGGVTQITINIISSKTNTEPVASILIPRDIPSLQVSQVQGD